MIFMRYLLFCVLAIILFAGCRKDNDSATDGTSRIDIYILESFNTTVDTSTNPFTISISNGILADQPLIENKEILFYTKSETTFKISKELHSVIGDYDSDKAFAITVDKEPVYFGKFHPGYLSSLILGVATIDPILSSDNELKIDFITLQGRPDLIKLDKRNDSRIIDALNASGRLR